MNKEELKVLTRDKHIGLTLQEGCVGLSPGQKLAMEKVLKERATLHVAMNVINQGDIAIAYSQALSVNCANS